MQDSAPEDNFFSRISCCVITGASKGLGKCIAKNFASKFPSQSLLILLARDLKSLECVESEIESRNLTHNPGLKIVIKKYDQGLLDEHIFDSLFADILQENGFAVSQFQQAVMVHNSGTIGDNSKLVRELSSSKTVKDNFDINVSGMILLNSAFLRMFTQEQFRYRTVINLSSLAALKPFKSWSLYCTGKAARDMFFKVLAAEEPDIRVLNYAPGPCQTDMQRQCREDTADPEVKQMFVSAHENGQILDCDTSIAKLMQILEKDNFESGAHVDYYDS